MQLLSRHWPRIVVTLIPLVFALMHASGALRIGVLQRLDDIIYDARLRATMPQTLDARKAKLARWPTVHRSAFSRQKQSRTFVQLIPQKIQLGKGFSRRPSALWTVNSFSIQAFLYWG